MVGSDRYVVVSTDSHVGPATATLHGYCPQRWAEDLAAYVDAVDHAIEQATRRALPNPAGDALAQQFAEDAGVDDPAARLRNMDADGIAAEVVFHGNNHHVRSRGYVPFAPISVGPQPSPTWSPAHQAAGKRMFNRWLADFCATAPDRLLGVAEIPWWDVDAACQEVRWAATEGLASVNLAAPRPGLPTYDDPCWEPFWATVEETGLALGCHSGTGLHQFPRAGEAQRALFWSETHLVGRMPAAMMILAGVFERHPGLRLILNEQRAYWAPQWLRELDAIYLNPINAPLRSVLPERPSTYWRRHCFIGGSFLAHFEIEDIDEVGLETVTWGRDYPHLEGTWPFTAEALRAALHDQPVERVRAILGTNAIRCYGLDAAALGDVAARIGPRPDDVGRPLAEVPPGARSWAFRDLATAEGGARFGAY